MDPDATAGRRGRLEPLEQQTEGGHCILKDIDVPRPRDEKCVSGSAWPPLPWPSGAK